MQVDGLMLTSSMIGFLPFFCHIAEGWRAQNWGSFSHLTLKVIQDCETKDIRFVLLPPNSTHLRQPLDVAYFCPLKRAWRKVLDDEEVDDPGSNNKNYTGTEAEEAAAACEVNCNECDHVLLFFNSYKRDRFFV